MVHASILGVAVMATDGGLKFEGVGCLSYIGREIHNRLDFRDEQAPFLLDEVCWFHVPGRVNRAKAVAIGMLTHAKDNADRDGVAGVVVVVSADILEGDGYRPAVDLARTIHAALLRTCVDPRTRVVSLASANQVLALVSGLAGDREFEVDPAQIAEQLVLPRRWSQETPPDLVFLMIGNETRKLGELTDTGYILRERTDVPAFASLGNVFLARWYRTQIRDVQSRMRDAIKIAQDAERATREAVAAGKRNVEAVKKQAADDAEKAARDLSAAIAAESQATSRLGLLQKSEAELRGKVARLHSDAAMARTDKKELASKKQALDVAKKDLKVWVNYALRLEKDAEAKGQKTTKRPRSKAEQILISGSDLQERPRLHAEPAALLGNRNADDAQPIAAVHTTSPGELAPAMDEPRPEPAPAEAYLDEQVADSLVVALESDVRRQRANYLSLRRRFPLLLLIAFLAGVSATIITIVMYVAILAPLRDELSARGTASQQAQFTPTLRVNSASMGKTASVARHLAKIYDITFPTEAGDRRSELEGCLEGQGRHFGGVSGVTDACGQRACEGMRSCKGAG